MATDLKSTAISPTLSDQFCKLVQEKTGLLFGADKHQEVCKKLAATMSFCDCQSMPEYYTYLRNQPTNSPAWERCVRELTVGETYFFRNKGHFDAMREHVLPELIAQRRDSRYLRIWSAGCSTGEEPYSLAITLHELLPDIADWNITILATDINRQSLEVAHRARYRSWSFRGVDSAIVARYFAEEDGWFTLNPKIRSMVKFDYLNLAQDTYPSLSNNTFGLDLILCRNVTIYFSLDMTREVIKRFHGALINGGWLFPGSSEPNLMTYQDLTPRNYPGAVVYRKLERETPPLRPVAPPSFSVPAVSAQTQTALRAKQTVMPDPPKPVERPQPLAHTSAEQISDMHYHDALSHWQSGRVNDAIALLQANIDRCPKHVESYHALARIQADRGQLDQAERICERAIARDRRHYAPYFVLSMIYQGRGQLAEAIEALRKVVLFSPRFVLGHYSLATLLASQGEQVLSRQSFEQTRMLLQEMPQNALLPEGDGMLVGSLLQIVDRRLKS